MSKGFVFGERPREFDQFFTKESIAKQCVERLNQKFSIDKDFLHIIEPSHGNMSFVDALQQWKGKLTFMDIDSKCEETRKDFLQFTHTHTHTLVIGNPPFGKNSCLAIAFFNHAAIFAKVIAFIVPKTFRKTSVTNKLDLNFELVDEMELEKDSFEFNGKDYDVPCVFQIWKKGDEKRKKTLTVKQTRDFKFIKNQTQDCDLVLRRVGVNAGRLYDNMSVSYSVGSHCFISLIDKTKKEEVVQNIKTLNLEQAQEKYNVAGNPCLNTSEICNLYNKKFF